MKKIVIVYSYRYFLEAAIALSKALEDLGYPNRMIENIDLVDDLNHNMKNVLYIFYGMNYYRQPLPPSFMIVQCEQHGTRWFNGSYFNRMCNALQVLEYSKSNIPILLNRAQVTKGRISYMNFGYHPCLESPLINPKHKKDFDVLFFGALNQKRRHLLESIRCKKLNLCQTNSAWDDKKWHLLNRSKIVLNCHFYDAGILEVFRIFPILSNNHMVISEYGSDPELNKKLEDIVVFGTKEEIPDLCLKYAKDDKLRNEWVAKASQRFKKEFLFADLIPIDRIKLYL